MGSLRQITKYTLERLIPERFLVSRTRQAAIHLTFDDGPHPEHTPALLDALKTFGMTATFFVVGREAERFPDIVERIARDGHTVGNHTWTHSEPSEMSTAQLMVEVDRTSGLLEHLTGSPCRLFRPPKGVLTPGKLVALLCRCYTVALWNVDTKDYRMNSSADMQVWLKQCSLHNGDVVLMHDNHPYSLFAVQNLRATHASALMNYRALCSTQRQDMDNHHAEISCCSATG